jgi:phage repressor protein C with HTH and peptisase S24 domain
MESTLHDGDLVIIERGRPRAISPGVYVLARDDVLLIKRLHLRADGRVEIRSDNKSYPTETMSSAEFDALHIVGRMIRRVVR